MELDKVKIYRITHIKNIPHILKFGITHKDSQNRNPDYKNIGDTQLIDTRSKRTVIIDNGDYNSNNEYVSITLGDYIPFYFGVKMPMLYVAQNGGNFVEKASPPYDIIYLESVHNVRYLRCCKNFNSSYTLVYCGLKFLRALISNIL